MHCAECGADLPGDEMQRDPSRLAIMGDSVGKHMAAVVTLMAKQRGEPKIRFQVLLYPVTQPISDNDSYRTFANGPWLTLQLSSLRSWRIRRDSAPSCARSERNSRQEVT